MPADTPRDDEPVLHRVPRPVPGKRKPPSGQVKALPPKLAGEEPGHGEASAHLLAALADVRFPATRSEILAAAGSRLVPLDDVRTVRLSQVVAKTAKGAFTSARDFVAEANAVWDDVARVARGGPEKP